MRNSLLFIALNGHQRRYFRALGAYLQTDYNIYHVDYSVANIANSFINTQISDELDISQSEIDAIIHFLLIKAQHRKFGFLRRFLHSRSVLIRQTNAAINYFYDFIKKNNIDMVCVWNGTLPPLGAATCVAKKLGLQTMYFENGYLPNTTTVDPRGVNNNNSLVGQLRTFYEAVPIDANKLQNVYIKPPAIRELKSRWYQRLFKRKPIGQAEDVQLPERYVLIPFQVHDDTQVLLHSPHIKTMPELMDFVVPAVDQHNKRTGDNLRIVAKEHPSDFGRTDYHDLQEKYYNKVMFLRYYPTPELIKQAKAIITINSSVGIEALLAHKPVLTIGNAFYNVPDLVDHIANFEDLIVRLESIDKPVDAKLIDAFIYYLRYFYLAEGSWRNPDQNHFISVSNKLAQVLEKNKSQQAP